MTKAVWKSPALRNRAASGVGGGHDLRKPEGVEQVDLRALERDLRRGVRGEVLFDAGHRAVYSHDSSNYRQAPLGVVCPRDPDDLVAAVAACRAHGAPILPRGCGTSLSGETINVAVVLDVSKHLREIVEVDAGRGRARVHPGVIRDQLSNQTEAAHQLTFAPDTSTHAYATLGGMLGNNSCGIHSVMAGRTSDNVEELEIVTYDGVRMRVGATSEAELERIVREGGAAEQAVAGRASCCGPAEGSCCGTSALAEEDGEVFGASQYGEAERGELPEAAQLASLGCGNPTAVAELGEGETVLDLGSGGGIDVLLSARPPDVVRISIVG